MEKALFPITCTTCQARLVVRDASAIGQIHECPRCGSLVRVVPPDGWVDPSSQQAEREVIPAAEVGAVPILLDPPSFPPTAAEPVGAGAPSVLASAAEAAPGGENAIPIAGTGAAWLEKAAWGKWLLLASVSAVGLAVAASAISIRLIHRAAVSRPTAVTQRPVESPQNGQPAVTPPQEALPDRLQRRWLPDRTTLLISLWPAQLAADPNSSRLLDQAGEVWQKSFGAVMRSLGLRLEDIRRITWAATDLAAWPEQSVAVVELSAGRNTAGLARIGEAADFGLAGVTCRRLLSVAWPHPLAVVDRQTVVTGDEALLRHLAGRSEIHLQSIPLERLSKAMAPEADFLLLLDLAAARRANWRLPAALWDFWPAGKQPWHVLWELPDGLGCAWRCGDHLRGELAWVCEGETAAEKARAALDEFMPAAKNSLPAQIEAIPQRLKAGQFTVTVAGQYEFLLKQAFAGMQAARWEVSDGIVWMRVDWGELPAALWAAALDSGPTVWADWLSAARTADEATHRRLLAGLGGYQKAEGRFPAGAAGGALLPPETRLSWIATLLPYYDHADWHRKLEFGYPWNGPQNRPVSRRPLPEVINPALGPEVTEAGFPVTHYVGVAGVGEDAGQLAPDHPRAGMFGYGRGTRPGEITKGAANTIALLGVSGRLGAWAAGGEPTVRALTRPPYVNGPDGFGSGQPDGMLAGMADGSVRFISKQVDPHVLEQLATIRGSDSAAALALGPKADPARPAPAPAKLNPHPQDETSGEPSPGAEALGPRNSGAAGESNGRPQGQERSPTQRGTTSPGAKKAVRGPESARPATIPAPAEVTARLAAPIAAVELKDVPLLRAVRLLSSMGNVPMTFDPDPLLELEVTLSDPVTVRLSQTTVGQALEVIVSGRGLVYAVESGQVVITSPASYRETLRPRRYTVSDLTGGDPAALAEMAALVQRLVVPDSWRANGGRGTLNAEAGVLQVVQTEAVHHHILTFCEKLRTARGRPLRSRLDPDRFLLTTRLDQAKQILDRTVTVNFHEPTPLAAILAYLEELTQADILIDGPALSAAGQPVDRKATLKAEKRPLAAALDELLTPLGLAYRVIDAETLQVTSRKALQARLELEFYPVATALAKGETGPALAERIKSRLAGATWSDAGGPGVVYFDKPSGCLIVLQSQPVHAAIQQLLAEKPN